MATSEDWKRERERENEIIPWGFIYVLTEKKDNVYILSKKNKM